MRKEFTYVLLAIVVALTLTVRLYFAFSTPYFSDDTSYYQLRQIEAIQQQFIPKFYDPLSFGGRLFLFSPLFHYLFAFLTSFGSNWYLTKIIPYVFAYCPDLRSLKMYSNDTPYATHCEIRKRLPKVIGKASTTTYSV